MGRRRKGSKIDGWLIIDKPLGISSSSAVGRVKYFTKAQKVGHGGTLDPLASGVLPIGLGEATKTMPFIVDASKEYEFTLEWGTATDSDDKEGAIIHSGGHTPSEEEVRAVLGGFIGTIEQVPPAYSAIKVDGQRAYKLARDGEHVELKARNVKIQSLTLLGHSVETHRSRFHVECGKGTYIRSLGRDIAQKLETWAHVTVLRRTRVGPFCVDKAISLEKLEQLSHSAPAAEYILPVVTALDDILALAITELEAEDIKYGRSLQCSKAKQGTFVLMAGDMPVAIAVAKDGIIRPLRVFNM